ncbi:hypothetical protein A3Q56_00111 [Intoshia linei]|uniref:Uncharacterized protein n=1 Tax=Intoshia linei TaxID=1819745 RepID=A0A177BD62_9BILA|nr:hypothetical protein A3Q56_00111 [Intoshia linei]
MTLKKLGNTALEVNRCYFTDQIFLICCDDDIQCLLIDTGNTNPHES